MHRSIGRRRVAPVALVAALALGGTASAAVVNLPSDGSPVNDDPALGIDPAQDAGVNDVVGGSLAAGGVAVPWATFEQKTGASQQIFVRAFKNGRWTTQGQSLNIQANQEAEAPSIDFAGAGRTVPWTAWYEPNTDLGPKTQIFASRFNAAGNTWIPEGQDRTNGDKVPSLNIHTDQDAENPSVAGGATVAGSAPTPWISWQEVDGAQAKDQIFVSKGIATPSKNCSANLPNVPGSKTSVSTFCWQEVGLGRVAGDPSLNIDRQRDGVEPDNTFSGPGDTVPWVVWYEKGPGTPGLRANEQVFAAKAVADASAAGGFKWIAVGNGTAGQGNTNVLDATGGPCSLSQAKEDGCSLNLAPGHDAEDPAVAAGTQTPRGITAPWVAWSEDNGSGIHQIFVSRLVGGDHFELMNDGQPISTVVNDSTNPDIAFSGHTPYVSWLEDTNGAQAGGVKTFVGHFEGNAFKTDTTAAGVADVRSPVSSANTANPFNADGDAPQGGAAGTPFFDYLNDTTGPRQLKSKAYAPSDVTTIGAFGVGTSGATVAGSLNPAGAATKAHFEFGTTTAYGQRTPEQLVGVAVTPQAVTAPLTGLPAGTTIHFRLVADTDFGPVAGADQAFTTQTNGQGGGGNPNGSGDRRAPKLALLGKAKIKLDAKGRVHLIVRADETARGTLLLRRGTGTAGRTTLALKAGKKATVVVKLTKATRRAVRHSHGLKLTELLRVRDAAGNTATAGRTLTVRA